MSSPAVVGDAAVVTPAQSTRRWRWSGSVVDRGCVADLPCQTEGVFGIRSSGRALNGKGSLCSFPIYDGKKPVT